MPLPIYLNQPDRVRGRRSISITADLLENLFQNGLKNEQFARFTLHGGIPEGARLVHAQMDHRGDLVLWFEHESWDVQSADFARLTPSIGQETA